jgi:hypothetical protein
LGLKLGGFLKVMLPLLLVVLLGEKQFVGSRKDLEDCVILGV